MSQLPLMFIIFPRHLTHQSPCGRSNQAELRLNLNLDSLGSLSSNWLLRLLKGYSKKQLELSVIQDILVLSNWRSKFWDRRFVFSAASCRGRVPSALKTKNSHPKARPDLGNTLSSNSLEFLLYPL